MLIPRSIPPLCLFDEDFIKPYASYCTMFDHLNPWTDLLQNLIGELGINTGMFISQLKSYKMGRLTFLGKAWSSSQYLYIDVILKSQVLMHLYSNYFYIVFANSNISIQTRHYLIIKNVTGLNCSSSSSRFNLLEISTFCLSIKQ